MLKSITTVAISLLISSAAIAQEAAPSPEDIKAKQAQIEADLAKTVASANSECGTKWKATIVWDGFEYETWKGYSVGSFCGHLPKALKKLCGGSNAKKYIKKAVKSISCAYGGEEKRDLTFSKGAATLVLDFKAPNYDDYVRAGLLGKL